MAAMRVNHTWTDLPAGKKAVGCRWVLTIKYFPDGTIERLKACLVAQRLDPIPIEVFPSIRDPLP